MNPAQIELAGIKRVFHLGDSEVQALRDLTLSITAGEYVAVMGPSGSGKSTLLNLLGLLDRPNTGVYRLEGRDVTTLSPDEQARVRSQRIGFVFQSFHLVPRLSAAENIALPMVLAGLATGGMAVGGRSCSGDGGGWQAFRAASAKKMIAWGRPAGWRQACQKRSIAVSGQWSSRRPSLRIRIGPAAEQPLRNRLEAYPSPGRKKRSTCLCPEAGV